MRTYCIILTVALVTLAAASSNANATAESAATPAAGATSAPADLYKRAVKNLNDGMWFNDAIADLTEAVRLQPKNSDYHLALGCAEVDRAGSLAYAAFMTDQLLNDNAQYHKDYAKWQAAQSDPKSDDYGKPAPPLPPTAIQFRTKDDLTHLKLTGKEAVAQIIALGLAAQSEWKVAVRLTKAPADKAQAESVQGWGLQYERNLLAYTGYESKPIPGAPKQQDVIAAFTAATKDDPTNPAYWEGLGDAQAFIGLGSDDSQPQAISAWQRSLALNPGNVELRFRLLQAQTKSDPKAALATAEALAESDTGNSYIQYYVAALLFKQVHYNDVNDTPFPKDSVIQQRNAIIQKLATNDNTASEKIATDAIVSIERGNRDMRYEVPKYTPPVPKILWRAWDYWKVFSDLADFGLGNFAALRELARAAGGYAQVAATRGDIQSGVRAAWASIGIGQKLEGDWPVADSGPGDDSIIRVLVGIAVEAIGYVSLQNVYQIAGDSVMEQETANEYSALKERRKAYDAVITKSLQDNPARIYDNY